MKEKSSSSKCRLQEKHDDITLIILREFISPALKEIAKRGYPSNVSWLIMTKLYLEYSEMFAEVTHTLKLTPQIINAVTAIDTFIRQQVGSLLGKEDD